MLQEKIAKNLEQIKQEIKGYDSTIVAVSKYYSYEHIICAHRCGIRDFGESRVLDAIEKIHKLDDVTYENSSYHFIGHLQSNKAKKATGVFGLIHSLDSIKLAEVISESASEKGINQKVLVQVNNSFEESKHGIAPSQLSDFLNEIQNFKNIEVMGLMNIAPLGADEANLRKLFSQMYKLKEEFKLRELSMGMSNDYKIALDEGATIIRLGRILFE